MRRAAIGLAGAVIAALCMLAEPALASKSDDTLTWATNREVSVVDPYFNNTRELVIIGHMVWDGLVYLNPQTGEPEPLLATSWKWVDDTTLEFELRKGVKFHDGTDFDADDVVYTINFVSDKNNGVLNYNLVEWMQGAEKIDQYKVRIKLRAPFPPALAYLANYGFIVPQGNYDKAPTKPDGKKDYGAVKPVGTGPYAVTDVKAGEYIMMVKNSAYFAGGPKGTVQISKLRFRTIKDPNTQLAELMTGGIDWIWDVPKDQAERLADNPMVTVKNEKTMRISFIRFDVKGTSNTKVFTDKRVRMAVAYAINREAMTKNLVGPAAEVIHSACHPDQFACAQDVPKWSYDPAKAKALLKEAGYENGFEFDLYAYREREFTEAVIGDLAKVGIKANLKFLQFTALLPIIQKGETPAVHETWGSNSIPDAAASTAHYFTGSADDLVKDPEIIATINEANTTVDPGKRKQLYHQALTKIASEVYWVPMFTYAKYYAYSKNLDFTPTADEMPRFFEAKWK